MIGGGDVKLIAAKSGKPVPTWGLQVVAGALAVGFVFLNGGFAGLALPVYSGDPAGYISALIGLLVAAWGPVELLYQVIWKAIFEKVGLA